MIYMYMYFFQTQGSVLAPQTSTSSAQPDLSADYHPQQNLLASLTQSTPQQQKQIIGEHLYREIYAMHPDLAGKITGMLLEMDNSELLHMLEVPESLKRKVEEAIDVLREHQRPESLKRKVEEAVDACMPNRRMGQQQVGGGQRGMKFTPSVRNPPVPPPQSQVPQTQPDLSADYHPQQNRLPSQVCITWRMSCITKKQPVGPIVICVKHENIYVMSVCKLGNMNGLLMTKKHHTISI